MGNIGIYNVHLDTLDCWCVSYLRTLHSQFGLIDNLVGCVDGRMVVGGGLMCLMAPAMGS